MLKYGGLGLIGLYALRDLGRAAEPESLPHSESGGGGDSAHRFPRMMQEYLLQRVQAAAGLAEERRAALDTKADAEAYVRDTQARIRECFGPLPERTPLNPQVTRVTDRGDYRIEHVLFESRPGFLVAGNLYVPQGRVAPYPAILGKCGHQASGKADPRYQAYAQGLVRQGYVVLLIDPVGQGERSQYLDDNLQPTVRAGTRQHYQAGHQQVLVGEFLGTWRAWDGIRAIDYLISRSEVDAARVGITGHSGGGTLTTWLCALEPRLVMAAPVCFVTTFLHNLENEVSADPEQYPPRALAQGLDLADFLVPMAPRPLILLGEGKDFFDVRGLEESARRLQRLYDLLGVSDQVRLHIGPGYHDYSTENQCEMYRWFNRATKTPDEASLPAPVVEPVEQLWCTPRGQVADLGSKTVFSFTQERSRGLARARRPLDALALPAAVTAVLGLPPRRGEPAFRILRPLRASNYPVPHVASYAVETEPGVFAVVYRLHLEDPAAELAARPPRVGGRALLYVAHQSADAELRTEPLLRERMKAEPAAAVYLCDVRGVGESRPAVGGLPVYGPDSGDSFHAAHGLMLGYPGVGQRTYDVLRVLDWLQANGHNEIHICAMGWGALPAAFAALLSPLVTQVTLKRALTSFSAVAETENYHWPLSLILPGVLSVFDLPDCYRALAPKRLALIEPWEPGSDIP